MYYIYTHISVGLLLCIVKTDKSIKFFGIRRLIEILLELSTKTHDDSFERL